MIIWCTSMSFNSKTSCHKCHFTASSLSSYSGTLLPFYSFTLLPPSPHTYTARHRNIFHCEFSFLFPPTHPLTWDSGDPVTSRRLFTRSSVDPSHQWHLLFSRHRKGRTTCPFRERGDAAEDRMTVRNFQRRKLTWCELCPGESARFLLQCRISPSSSRRCPTCRALRVRRCAIFLGTRLATRRSNWKYTCNWAIGASVERDHWWRFWDCWPGWSLFARGTLRRGARFINCSKEWRIQLLTQFSARQLHRKAKWEDGEGDFCLHLDTVTLLSAT